MLEKENIFFFRGTLFLHPMRVHMKNMLTLISLLDTPVADDLNIYLLPCQKNFKTFHGLPTKIFFL